MQKHTTSRQKLLDKGLSLLLARGYNDLGIQALLDEAGVPRGSFYHHFKSKQAFALAVVDEYMATVHSGLDACLNDTARPPLDRVRRFFEISRDKYIEEGTLGCMLGSLGQELAAVDEEFRHKIESCFREITTRIAATLDQARREGALDSSCDPQDTANLILNCWEGAALRSRIGRQVQPLDAVLDFCFDALGAGASPPDQPDSAQGLGENP